MLKDPACRQVYKNRAQFVRTGEAQTKKLATSYEVGSVNLLSTKLVDGLPKDHGENLTPSTCRFRCGRMGWVDWSSP